MRRALALAVVALALASCATPSRLAKQSNEAIAKGDLAKAYDRAVRAVEKDGGNAEARTAYERASELFAAEKRAAVRARAAADSLGAAEAAREYARFRSEVVAHGASTRDDARWSADETLLYRTGASTWYRRGREALAARRPKAAWRAFGECRRFLDGWADAPEQQQRAFRQASVRVAVMPFTDGVSVPGLALETHERTAEGLAAAEDGFTFTQVVPRDSVDAALTLADARSLSRDAAMAAGRRLGAQRVVIGRFLGLRSSSDSRERTIPFVRRVEVRDAEGVTHVKWEEGQLAIVRRSRDVRLQTEFEVVDVRTGATVLKKVVPGESFAEVAWTDFRPEGDCAAYHLIAPDLRKADPARAKKADAAWKDAAGDWALPRFLEQAQKHRDRARYERGYRSEFLRDTRSRPVWLGELPGEDELAFCALATLDRPVVAALEELDARE